MTSNALNAIELLPGKWKQTYTFLYVANPCGSPHLVSLRFSELMIPFWPSRIIRQNGRLKCLAFDKFNNQ